MEGTFSKLKTIPGTSENTTYVVIAENEDVMVAIKPEVSLVNYDKSRQFFQIGLRIHVRPQVGKELPSRAACDEKLGIGYLADRDGSRYVGYARIPACNLTMSPWVVQEQITENHLVEKLVEGLCDRLETAGLVLTSPKEMVLAALVEQFTDMVPDNKLPMPEIKVYFGKDDYYPPEAAEATSDKGDDA